MRNYKNYILPVIIAITAFSVSASAAFYSVSGLSKLFAGAALAVTLMAGSLEVAKLVIASLLYRYWNTLNKFLRTYLTIATGILILITSLGIYGFLSSAYQSTASKVNVVGTEIKLLDTRRNSLNKQLEVVTREKEGVDNSITQLQSGLVNNKTQYVDKRGNLITSSSTGTRQALESQLKVALERSQQLATKIDNLTEEVTKLETESVEKEVNSLTASELGPLKYISELTGRTMNEIVNYLLLVIIFVFDPLAIALVLAANHALAELSKKENLYGEYDEGLWDLIDNKEKPTQSEVVKEEKEDDWEIVDEENETARIVQTSPSKVKIADHEGNTRWITKKEWKEDYSNPKKYL